MAVKAQLANDEQEKKSYEQQAISNFQEALNSVRAYNAGSSQDIQTEKAHSSAPTDHTQVGAAQAYRSFGSA
jgi:hypothetical protein